MPKAPGTFGTLLGIPLVMLFMRFGDFGYMVATLAFTVASIFIAELHERQLGTHDASEIVIDEVAGFLVTMTWLPNTWQAYVGGFLCFRFFDAIKPFPINLVDEKIKGGLGVVADDLVAGVIANIILQILYTKSGLLGAQLL